MADERLQNVNEFLLTLIVRVMYERSNMTATEIAKLATRRIAWKVDKGSVETILTQIAGAVVSAAGVPRCQVVRRRQT